MRYDERITLSWRAPTGETDQFREPEYGDFVSVDVWAAVSDEGTASFDIGSGLTRADAFVCTMRFGSMPEEFRKILQTITVRAQLGDFALTRCTVRDRVMTITSVTEGTLRRREISITASSREV